MKRLFLLLLIGIALIGFVNPINETLTIANDLNVTGIITLSNISYTKIEGDFIIRTMTIGTERDVEGILEDAMQMTSYEGDFYKYPELNVSSEISYSKLIANKRFTNKSECKMFYLGTRAEVIKIDRRFWFDSERMVFNPIISYVCEQKLNEIYYYDNEDASRSDGE